MFRTNKKGIKFESECKCIERKAFETFQRYFFYDTIYISLEKSSTMFQNNKRRKA